MTGPTCWLRSSRQSLLKWSVNTRLLIAALAGNLAELDIVNAELRQARACKDTLMFAYCRHMQRHGC